MDGRRTVVCIKRDVGREMEYIEWALFVEIYGLKIALPISLLNKFWFFKSTQHLNTV